MSEGDGGASTGRRLICVHGHFYQPPRENPWLDVVEREVSAAPFHDWNERITAECYRANVAARVTAPDGLVDTVFDNYRHISFDVAPTLMVWLARHAPEVHDAIVAADRDEARAHGGHGPALAHPYVHAILPLANGRDRTTLVRWGIADFRHRFGRDPEGMWLPETAVDLATLETLAAEGIAFTVLAPRQAADPNVDTTVAHRIDLPSGRSIAAFFYDGVMSQGIAFEGLLDNGDRFAEVMANRVPANVHGAPLVHVATDGESYGHHHRFGEMALAWALRRLLREPGVALTSYARFLAEMGTAGPAEIVEHTSWSCVHGVERWRSDCGCGSEPTKPSQAWRGPLRDALDWLRDRLAIEYEHAAAKLLADPWAARDAYVEVIGVRDPEVRAAWVRAHARDAETVDVPQTLALLEMQRALLMMYSSCAWFFADPAGIETVQTLRFAARALDLARAAIGLDLERELVAQLAAVRSNEARHGDGRSLWRNHVVTARAAVEDLAAVHALRVLVEGYAADTGADSYAVVPVQEERVETHAGPVVLGVVEVRDLATTEADVVEFAALPIGTFDVLAFARAGADPGGLPATMEAVLADVADASSPGALQRIRAALETRFAGSARTVEHLPPSAQEELLLVLAEETFTDVADHLRSFYEEELALFGLLAARGVPVPRRIASAAEVVVGAKLQDLLLAERFDVADAEPLYNQVALLHLDLDGMGVAGLLDDVLAERAAAVQAHPLDVVRLEELAALVRFARFGGPGRGIWAAQNAVVAARDAIAGDRTTKRARRLRLVEGLAQALGVRYP